MQVSKRSVIAGAALALGVLAAGTAVAAPASAHGTAAPGTAAPRVVSYTQADVAALQAKLPKGAKVRLETAAEHAAAQRAGSVIPAISSQGCNGQWGERVYDQNWNCVAYGYTGTTGNINTYAKELDTDNNYGWITFNKDLVQHNGVGTAQCQAWAFYTGTYDTGLLQYIHIDGWTNTTCGNWLVITF